MIGYRDNNGIGQILRKRLKTLDFIETGEGATDYQTLYGKSPLWFSLLAK